MNKQPRMAEVIFILGLGSGDRAFKLFSAATTNLVLDLAGYFAP